MVFVPVAVTVADDDGEMCAGKVGNVIALCSLWDSNYHAKGMALLSSLQRHARDFCIYVLALDDRVRSYFDSITIRGVIPIALSEIETPELLRAKANRTRTEYYWTLGSAFTWWCAQLFNPTALAYIDADCFLFGDISPLYDEVSGFPVAITPHRYTPSQAARLAGAGIYNVGWVYFEREGYECLRHWRNQCLEWCYHRIERELTDLR